MASLMQRSSGGYAVQFYDRYGRRRTIGMGRLNKRSSETVRVRLEPLIDAYLSASSPPESATRWLMEIDAKLRERIAASGIVPPDMATTVAGLLKAWIKAHGATVKASTRTTLEQAEAVAVEYFKADRPLSRVTRADAKAFRHWLLTTKNYAEATTRKRCSSLKAAWAWGMDARLVGENPWLAVPTAATGNAEKRYIGKAEADAIADKLPDADWRLLFALARWGGLRVPSEPKLLRWADVDWEKGRIRVRSPKTERHAGKSERWIPMFAELRGPLREAFDAAPAGDDRAVRAAHVTSTTRRKKLESAIKAAGFTPWPKLWTAMRSTRQTELADRFPAHVVSAWLGNSESVARKHYLQVTEEHWETATEPIQV